MTIPSFEKINYALRPAKNVERKMFCEAFARLAPLSPLHKYRYVGFGSIGFHDFSLFHQRLGIHDMVSIEARRKARKRVKFNRPYSCIRVEWGLSHTVLPLLKWNARCIVWLDYDRPLLGKMLEDIQLMSSVLVSGSILLVTVDAKPRPATPLGEVSDHRLADLVQRVGTERVPIGVTGKSLRQWGTARVSRDIIHNEIQQTLLDRNAAHGGPNRVRYQQLFNFHYEDGAKMLTVGGVFLDAADRTTLGGAFDDLDWVCKGVTPYRIETPILTVRELRFLDSKLPKGPISQAAKWLPAQELARYARLYRHFPTYTEVEM